MRFSTFAETFCLYGFFFALCSTGAAQAALLVTIASFNGTIGNFPRSALMMDALGNIFGTTELGGTNNSGTIFKIAAHTTTITSLAWFNGGTTGSLPLGGVVADSSGNLFGTTEGAGANSDGTVFELPSGSSSITTIASFSGTNGAHPYGSITFDSAGNMFGTTELGGTPQLGNVFKIAVHTTTITNVASFDNTIGNNPQAGLIADSSGNLYGTTANGGTSGVGTIFKVAAGSSAITTLTSFSGGTGPTNSYASLIRDSAGNLFGTTGNGGTHSVGTIFELPAGSSTVTVLASTSDGSPEAALLEDAAGNLFGTTFNGGTSQEGSVFELPAGFHTITTLVSFTGTNGQFPYGSLIADSAGNLYGTTSGGGGNGDGTVFEITGAGYVVAPEPSSFVLLVSVSMLAVAYMLATKPRRRARFFNLLLPGVCT